MPTLEEQILKALQNDNLELAKSLSNRLAAKLAKKNPPAKKAKAKPKKTTKKTTKRAKPKVDKREISTVSGDGGDDDCVAEAQPNKKSGRMVPLNKERHIEFTDDRDVDVSVTIKKGKKTITTSMDTLLWSGRKPTRRRPPVKKIETVCGKCNKTVMVFPSQIPERIADDAEDKPPYICNKCAG